VEGATLSDARAVVLERVRDALGPAPRVPEVPRSYRNAGSSSVDLELFCSRVEAYRARVHRVLHAAVTETVRDLAGDRIVASPAAPVDLVALGAVVDCPRLTTTALSVADTVVTGVAWAIVETGTLVLDGGPVCGRRALTLVPDHHVCVVDSAQLLATVPDAIKALGRAPIVTFVSGPSATSDIELERVEGVHGPRSLDVVLIDGDLIGPEL